MRRRQLRPSALQVKDNLRLLTVSQYMEDISNTSYTWDPREWLLNFPDHLKTLNDKRNTTASTEVTIPSDLSNTNSATHDAGNIEAEDACIELCNNLCNRSSEQNVVYYIAGMVLKQIRHRYDVCEECVDSCTGNDIPSVDIVFFTQLKDFTGSALVYVNVQTYNFFLELEEIFKKNIDSLKSLNQDLENVLFSLMSGVPALHMLDCHNIRTKIMKKFIQFRLKVSREKYQRDKRYDRKSMVI